MSYTRDPFDTDFGPADVALDLDAIKARAEHLAIKSEQYAPRSFQMASVDVPALVAEVERLQALVDMWVPKFDAGSGSTVPTERVDFHGLSIAVDMLPMAEAAMRRRTVIHLTVEREALATLIRHELAKDSAGFGSCDLGATIADEIVLAFDTPLDWECDHGCKGIRAGGPEL